MKITSSLNIKRAISFILKGYKKGKTNMEQSKLPSNVKKLNELFKTQCRNVIQARLRDYKNGDKDAFNKTINCLIIAWCQSGKSLGKASITGIFSSVLEEYAEQFKDLNINLCDGITALQGMIWMGVTSKELWEQHKAPLSTLQDYKFENSWGKKVKMNKVIDFTECLHYSKSKKTIGKRLEDIRKILQAEETGFIVLTDEAHKATGKKQKQNTFIQDYEKIESKTPKFRLSVTATPDFLNGKKNIEIYDLFDVVGFLEPGNDYWGAEEGLKDGRIKDVNGHINWTMKTKSSADDFVRSIIYPLWVKHQKSGDYKNFIVRVNTIKDNFIDAVRRVWTEHNQDVPALPYYTGGRYEELLTHIGKDKQHTQLQDNAFRLIELGIEAGVSIDHSVIGLWYETAKPTSKNKNPNDYYHNMSSHIQRVGRNFGYGAGNWTYPIYCDRTCVTNYVEEINQILNFLKNDSNPNHSTKFTGANSKVKTNSTNSVYNILNVFHFNDKIKIDNFALGLTDKSAGNTKRTDHNHKDYGASILNNQMKNHITKMDSRQITTGTNNRYLCCVFLDNNPGFMVTNNKYNTQEVWKQLSNTNWGNLQNKWVAVIVEEIYQSHLCQNNTFYGT